MTITQAGLQCGFGQELGAGTLAEVKAQGFTIVRIDLQDCSQEATTALAWEVINAGMQPLCIVRRVEQIAVLPQGSLVELGNEPDIKKFGWTKSSYRTFVEQGWPEILRCGHRGYVGVYSSFRERLDWLRDLPWDSIPREVGCTMHWYPGSPKQRDLLQPKDKEVAMLIDTVGPRPLGISETGFHDGAQGWPEEEVAQHMANVRQFYAKHGFDFVVGFQINDGPNQDTESHFGFRRLDGTWKPVSAAFTQALEGAVR